MNKWKYVFSVLIITPALLGGGLWCLGVQFGDNPNSYIGLIALSLAIRLHD